MERGAGARGFTLIEVLLALGLSVVVMAAVGVAVNTYMRLSTERQVDVEQARIAQAVLRKIERDIRSVVFRQPQPVANTTGQAAASTNGTQTGQQPQEQLVGTGFDPLSGGTTQSMPVDTTTAYTTSDVGLFGDSTTLIVHVSRPSREMNYQPLFNGDAAGSRSSDLQSVSWFLAVANGSGLQGAVGNVASGGSVRTSRETGVQGLARIEGDRLAMNLADAEGNSQSMADQAEIVADEITYLTFAYFDGAAWTDTWDSQAMGALPRAVEIVIGFAEQSRGKSARETALENLSGGEVGQTYRLVVALPLSP